MEGRMPVCEQPSGACPPAVIPAIPARVENLRMRHCRRPEEKGRQYLRVANRDAL